MLQVVVGSSSKPSWWAHKLAWATPVLATTRAVATGSTTAARRPARRLRVVRRSGRRAFAIIADLLRVPVRETRRTWAAGRRHYPVRGGAAPGILDTVGQGWTAARARA